ncbi:MAG: UDP-2,3-diacylglucosamine diphosphatase [Candidatus Hydrogenedentes bacterium]|nr:UDP-2,3-diacylglucosamine diphosphatase [Candidatus Hydrogenedentota bacterium]
MNTVIFSDVHLNVAEDGRDLMEKFTAFLSAIDPASTNRIVILGDLFDFWFEYKHVIFSGYFNVLRAFADLSDAGVEIHFVIGNHDFWAGRFLRQHLRFQIHEDLTLDLNGKRALFIHGDGINPGDSNYRLYKRIARSPIIVRLFGLIHPDWAMGLAQGVSRGSRHMKKVDDLSQGAEVAPLREFARAALVEGRADIVFCGHSHYPVMETFPTPGGEGLYINTGDWLYHQSYIEWDGTTFHQRSVIAEPHREEIPERHAQRRPNEPQQEPQNAGAPFARE